MFETKLPVPFPSLFLLLAIVGLELVLQQIPLAEIVAPPSEVILPPLDTVVFVIDEAETVVIEGNCNCNEFVLKDVTMP